MTREDIIRNYLSAWEKQDWEAVQSLLSAEFSFNSPVDDHIDLEAFEKKCWPIAASIKRIDVDKVIESGDEAFARYTSVMSNDHTARCTEFFTFENDKIRSIDVFWGFPWSGS